MTAPQGFIVDKNGTRVRVASIEAFGTDEEGACLLYLRSGANIAFCCTPEEMDTLIIDLFSAVRRALAET